MTVAAADPGSATDREQVAAVEPITGDDGPFPGLASYDYDRRSSFLGRDLEIQHIAMMILGRRLTILTAGSGDGKTSLIHAGLAPALLSDQIEIAVAETGLEAGQPFAAIEALFLDRLLPQPASLAPLLDRLIGRFGGSSTLAEARQACSSIAAADRQILLNGERASRPTEILADGPLASWLRDAEISDDYAESAMMACFGEAWPGLDASLWTIRAAIAAWAPEPEPSRPFERPSVRLLAKLEAAIERRRLVDPLFEAVLVLDQFEEVFVRLTGSDPSGTRREILDAVLELTRRSLPVRLVLSLRKEHYADLQTALGNEVALEPSTYHLQALPIKQAEICLAQQRWAPDEAPSRDLVQKMVANIAYDGFVNPTLLSVAGQHLWTRRKVKADVEPSMPFAIEAFVRKALESELNEIAQLEAFDMFDQLTLRDGLAARRASIAESTLVNAPLRDADLRRKILDMLQRNRLVRRAPGLGKVNYVEVVHESLLLAVQTLALELRTELPICAELPALIDDIRAEAREMLLQLRPIPNRLYPVLLENIERLRPPPHLAARMFGRLLLDPNLREIARRGDPRPPSKPGSDPWSVAPQRTVRLRELYRKLDKAAASPQDDPPDAQRLVDGDLMTPEEADGIGEGAGSPPDLDGLRLALSSALTHRDKGAHDRIRRVGHRLKAMEPVG